MTNEKHTMTNKINECNIVKTTMDNCGVSIQDIIDFVKTERDLCNDIYPSFVWNDGIKINTIENQKKIAKDYAEVFYNSFKSADLPDFKHLISYENVKFTAVDNDDEDSIKEMNVSFALDLDIIFVKLSACFGNQLIEEIE